MITRRGRLAFANARVRALKSRLFGHEMAARLTASAGPDAEAGAALPALIERQHSELIDWYAIVLASYPSGQALIRALLLRHEIENLKLAWRVVPGHLAAPRWLPLWIRLGSLATLTTDAVREAPSLTALVSALAATPCAAIAEQMLRSHANDQLAAEMGFDLWTSRQIVSAADRLSSRDARARTLAYAVVRERDLLIVRRAATKLGVGPEAEVTALSPQQLKIRSHANLDLLSVGWRRERREQCRRAFLDQPFCLAPAVALLLLKEEEVHGLGAIAECGPAAEGYDARARVLVAGAMGA